MTLLTPRRLMVWGLGLFAVSWFIHLQTTLTPGLVDRVGRFKGSDYVQFYVMGSLLGEGRGDELYDASAHLSEGRRRIDSNLELYAAHPNYGPQVALAFVPLAALPYGWSLTVFLALSGICYALSVWLVWRDCERLRPHGRVVAVLAAASPLVLTVVRYGQASAVAVLAFALALAAFKRGRLFLAGVAIGCLAYKPQLGVLFGIVLVATRQWRAVGGAATAVAAQMAIAWIAAGSQTMMRYFAELWLLVRDPRLVQTQPSELYSIRGFVHLLVPYEPVVAACGAAALIAAIVLAVRSWSSTRSLNVRFGELIVLTILASPHLISYDLLLLTIPLILFADWVVQHEDHRFSVAMRVALVLLYFAPFSGMIVARLTGIQVAVIVMAWLAWMMDRSAEGHPIAHSPRDGDPVASRSTAHLGSTAYLEREASAERQDSFAIVAPRCDAVSSQNSTTRGWRSSAA